MPDTIPSTRKRHPGGVIGGLIGVVALSAAAGLLVAVAVTPGLATASTAATSAINAFDNLPSELHIEDLQLPTTIYAKDPASGHYRELTRFYDQNRVPVKWDQIAPVMYDAILSSEDPRFFQEGGIDIVGTARAMLSNLRGQSNIQGGSSISQQYVKNVLVQDCYGSVDDKTFTPDKKAVNGVKLTAQQKRDAAIQACYINATTADGHKGYARKLQEMRYAIALDKKYSKDQILLAYLNIANFGGTTYGIEAASEYYFGVHASQLSLVQAAALAGMVQNPNTFRIDLPNNKENGKANHYALTTERQQYVLRRMKTLGKITTAQYALALKAPIVPKITPAVTGCARTAAPYYCAYVRSIILSDAAFGATATDRKRALRQGGLKIYTTLDWRLQKVAQATVSKYAPGKWPSYGYGSTIVNVQPSTGHILSIAQNTKYADTGRGNGKTSIVYAGNAAQAAGGFPAGSSFKLFTLIDWLEQGHTLSERVNGVQRVIPRLKNSCQGDWVNYDRVTIPNFRGEGRGFSGSPLQFTKISLNTGFIGMAEKLDLCDVMKVATRLGVTLTNGKPVRMTTMSSVIGTNPVSPLAMAGAYAAIANNGRFCQPQAIARVTDAEGNDHPIPERTCKQVVAPNIAATAQFALRSVLQGGGTGAAGNPHDGTQLFGKTGTNNGDQTWLIESSTAMTSLVWSGVTDHRGLGTKINMFHAFWRGVDLASIRFPMAARIQAAADRYYPGGSLPPPDQALVRGRAPAPVVPSPGGGNGGGDGNGGGGGGRGHGGGNSGQDANPTPTPGRRNR